MCLGVLAEKVSPYSNDGYDFAVEALLRLSLNDLKSIVFT